MGRSGRPMGGRQERVMDVKMNTVHDIHVWKCQHETHYLHNEYILLKRKLGRQRKTQKPQQKDLQMAFCFTIRDMLGLEQVSVQ